MADENATDEERRKAEAARLRAAARSTTPEAYKVRTPRATADPMAGAGDSYSTLFGAYFAGSQGWRQHLATAMQLGAHGLAYVALVLLLNIAQCEWWYEPGMYGGPDGGRAAGR